ncbi:hypothetical protein [Alkalihalobacillus deserti]|nr:hypothetical protein [Alkalihalobacillus deserti]
MSFTFDWIMEAVIEVGDVQEIGATPLRRIIPIIGGHLKVQD